MEHTCLNCNATTTGKFCANCGQKTDTHRITFGHFLAHDLLHGVFHLERGILFTLKEAFVRPGKAALDYISGKRIRYYNVFYLSLILIGLAVLIAHTGEDDVAMKGGDTRSQEVVDFLGKNVKMVVLAFVPLLALNARLLFWKIRLNLAEHFIMAGFAFVGVLALVDVMLTVNAIAGFTTEGIILNWLLFLLIVCAFLFPCWAYTNLTWKTHSILGIAWRMLIFYVLLLWEMFLLIALTVWLITGQTDLTIN